MTSNTTTTKKQRLRVRKWSPAAHRVLAYLTSQADPNGNVRNDLTQDEIADEVQCNRSYVPHLVQFLEAVNVLTVTRDGRRTYYRVSSAVPPNVSAR